MIPELFKERAKELLGSEYEAFIAEIEENPAVRAVRINTVKADENYTAPELPFDTSPLSYARNGYLLNGENRGIGNTPEHHAGIIYIQDPGAMASASALDIEPDFKVIDLCAAPGGKSGQALAQLTGSGFLISNEYVPKRAKILVSNMERLGAKNCAVTSLDTGKLAEMYGAYFDLVIADAPCSGEGMFRKCEDALSEWSIENINLCSERQREILDNAAGLVRAGGYLLYSTCTYSIEENEMQVDAFLERYPDFSLCDVKDSLKKITADGIVFDGAKSKALNKCRRFYPHVSKGEGQFIALLKRSGESNASFRIPKAVYKAPSREEAVLIEGFFKENLKKRPEGKLLKVGTGAVIVPESMHLPEYSLYMSGVLVGEARGRVLVPSHHFFSAYGKLFKNQIEIGNDSEKCTKYLRGEEIEASEAQNGWCAVLYKGAVLGGGKISGGRLKNHYPKGLRNN